MNQVDDCENLSIQNIHTGRTYLHTDTTHNARLTPDGYETTYK